MAITRVTAYVGMVQIHIFGLNADSKPTTGINIGERFLETDTGSVFVWTGTAWVASSDDTISIEGPDADNTAITGNPVLGGLAVDETARVTRDEGGIVPAVGTPEGQLLVVIEGDGSTNRAAVLSISSDGSISTAQYLLTRAVPFALAPDGSFDRARTAGDTAGSGLGSLMVSPAGHAFNNVTADEQIMAAAGKLHGIVIHDVTVGGVITIYDNTAESGTVIATLTLVAGESFILLVYDVECATGLFIGYDANVAADLTVSYAI